MAVKQVVVSDIGGAELDEFNAAKLRVSGYPALNKRTVVLDIAADEAEKFRGAAKDFVYLELDVPGEAPRELILDVAAFEEAFGKADVARILGAAQQDAKPAGQPRRRARGGKPDYTSPEHAGKLHRGKVTEAEAKWVRENLDQANRNREKAGQPYIDPNGEADKRRYGL